MLAVLMSGLLFGNTSVLAATASASTPPPIRPMIGFDQRLGEKLPLATGLTNAAGERVALGDVIHDRPAVLLFGYFTCPQLCGVTVDGTLDALVPMKPAIGVDYDLVYLSIDPADTPAMAAEKQAAYARRYGRGTGEAGWHVLTGDAAAITRVTNAAGFRFLRVVGTDEFAHASGFLVVQPDGTISRVFPGIDFRPAEVAAALRDAAAGRTGEPVFDLLLACFSGGLRPGIGRWAFLALQLACGLTVAILALGIVRMLRAERRAARPVRAREEVTS
jgi:protein SCO1/2